MNTILWGVVWFCLFGAGFGFLLGMLSKHWRVEQHPKIQKICELLPGVNCGGCGYAGCRALATAISEKKAAPNACPACDEIKTRQIAEIAGMPTVLRERRRAQVMCSGTVDHTKRKYVYAGVLDCNAAARLGGGEKICRFGCIGLGTCVEQCRFNAIRLANGVASVDYTRCTGCGVCELSCPKGIIRLIPFDSNYWVGCASKDKGAQIRDYCDVGCISCHRCEKICKFGAITVTDHIASIDYKKCVGCGACVSVCPRGIIASGRLK